MHVMRLLELGPVAFLAPASGACDRSRVPRLQ